MEIKVLGTVSPKCYDNKNCPGYLINTGNKKILLDCGNGSTKYINTPEELSDIIIIISHLHRDHWGDLLSLGYDSYVLHNLGILKDRVKVYIPEYDPEEKLISTYLDPITRDLCQTTKNDSIADYEFLLNLGEEQFLEFITYNKETKLKIDDMEIDFSENPHQIHSYSIRVKDKDTTVVYSGDTGFKNNTLTALATNADLLICESTFLSNQPKKLDYHLTTTEAATIAKDANVKRLLLTHFYPTIEKDEYVKEALEVFGNTEAAEEGKVLKIGVKK